MTMPMMVKTKMKMMGMRMMRFLVVVVMMIVVIFVLLLIRSCLPLLPGDYFSMLLNKLQSRPQILHSRSETASVVPWGSFCTRRSLPPRHRLRNRSGE